VQLWMILTPVIYGPDLIPERYRPLYDLNPMAVVADGMRCALLGTARPDGATIALSAAAVAFVLVTGANAFRWAERTLVDVL